MAHRIHKMQTFRPGVLGALPATLVLLSACFTGPESGPSTCTRDEDCPELCSRIGECLRAADAISIRTTWTVGGAAPTPSAPTPCGAIDALEVSLESGGARDLPILYYPVPCNLGQVFYDRMPNRLERVRFSAVHADGRVLQVVLRDIVDTASEFQVDFNTQ